MRINWDHEEIFCKLHVHGVNWSTRTQAHQERGKCIYTWIKKWYLVAPALIFPLGPSSGEHPVLLLRWAGQGALIGGDQADGEAGCVTTSY